MCSCAKWTGSNHEKCLAFCAVLDVANVPAMRVLPSHGITFRWWGIRWYGIPKPVVWLWPITRRISCMRLGVAQDTFPARVTYNVGCGCIVWLKDHSERLLRWFRR